MFLALLVFYPKLLFSNQSFFFLLSDFFRKNIHTKKNQKRSDFSFSYVVVVVDSDMRESKGRNFFLRQREVRSKYLDSLSVLEYQKKKKKQMKENENTHTLKLTRIHIH